MRANTSKKHTRILLFVTLISLGVLYLLPSISQDPHYHHFADDRKIIGIPNFLNVISNLPFLIVGFLGLKNINRKFSFELIKEAMICFYIGVILTGLGSSWYHLNPNNRTLLWDRLPMALTFMSLLSTIVSMHIEPRSGKLVLLPLLTIGVGSVLYWYFTEINGKGDLRPYIFVQFFPMLMIPLIMFLYPLEGNIKRILIPMIGMYMLAKYFEFSDHNLYAFGKIISGHSLKHLFAACATASLLNIDYYNMPQNKRTVIKLNQQIN